MTPAHGFIATSNMWLSASARPSRNYLIYQVTVEDPKVLTKPWVSAPHKFSLSVRQRAVERVVLRDQSRRR